MLQAQIVWRKHAWNGTGFRRYCSSSSRKRRDAGPEGKASAGSFLMSGSCSGMPTTCLSHGLHQADVSELLLSSGGYVLPLVPALRLGDTNSLVHTPRSDLGSGTARSLSSRSLRGHGSSSDMPLKAADRTRAVASSSVGGGPLPPPEARSSATANVLSPVGRATAVQWAPMPYDDAVTCNTGSRDKDSPTAARATSSSGCLLLACAHDAEESEPASAASSPSSRGRSHALPRVGPAHAAPGEATMLRHRDSLSSRTDSLARRQSSLKGKGRSICTASTPAAADRCR